VIRSRRELLAVGISCRPASYCRTGLQTSPDPSSRWAHTCTGPEDQIYGRNPGYTGTRDSGVGRLASIGGLAFSISFFFFKPGFSAHMDRARTRFYTC
jgi:hypothetical protein